MEWFEEFSVENSSIGMIGIKTLVVLCVLSILERRVFTSLSGHSNVIFMLGQLEPSWMSDYQLNCNSLPSSLSLQFLTVLL